MSVVDIVYGFWCVFFSSRRRHTRCELVTGVQTCALPISCVFGVRPMQIEKRATAGVSANGRKLTGYVAKFDTPTTIGGGFTETTKRGALAASLARDRAILAIADPPPAPVLGRPKSGSLTLDRKSVGLGKSVSVSVYLGGCRFYETKKYKIKQ